jgi:hypothetical protein
MKVNERLRDKGRSSQMQSVGIPLSDEEFCLKEGLDSSYSELVSTIRRKVGKFSNHDPLHIYPEDSFSDLGITYGVLEMLMDGIDVEFEWEPSCVGEFVLEVVRLRKEREQRQRANVP